MNVEEAYELIAKCAIAEAGTFSWDSLLVEITVFNKMCKFRHWLFKNDKKMQGDGKVGAQETMGVSRAVFVIRDNILESTGQRIWGLVFTLSSAGKFNIEYSYDKPEGYEETDELVSGDEINQSLNKISP